MKAVPLCLVVALLGASARSAAAQTSSSLPTAVQNCSFGYARLGYGAVLAAGGGANPAIGFGYRAERDSFGLDISFLNEQLPSGNGLADGSTAMAGSLLKLEGLYFRRARTHASAYAGAGIGLGTATLSGTSSSAISSTWDGSGLQGELTVGYELLRASTMRVFVQGDASLPFYRATGRTFSATHGQVAETIAGRRYAPSMVVSLGMGWQRHRS